MLAHFERIQKKKKNISNSVCFPGIWRSTYYKVLPYGPSTHASDVCNGTQWAHAVLGPAFLYSVIGAVRAKLCKKETSPFVSGVSDGILRSPSRRASRSSCPELADHVKYLVSVHVCSDRSRLSGVILGPRPSNPEINLIYFGHFQLTKEHIQLSIHSHTQG